MSDHMAQRMDDLIEAGKHWEAEKPLSDVCEHFLNTSHEDLAESFANVDWVMQEWLLSEQPMSPQAIELREKLKALVKTWSA